MMFIHFPILPKKRVIESSIRWVIIIQAFQAAKFQAHPGLDHPVLLRQPLPETRIKPHLKKGRPVGETGPTKQKAKMSLPSGKLSHNYGKSPCLMGKLTISMAIFNSYVKLPEGTIYYNREVS
jgi:hypothetical protein